MLRIRRAVVLADGEFVVKEPEERRRGPRRGDPAAPAADGPRAPGAHRAGPGRAAVPRQDDPTKHLRQSTLARVFYPAREAAGRPDLRFHDLRHTGAVLAAQSGATLAELMGRLGHSTPQAAMRYQHAAADRDALIAARLSAMIEPVAAATP